MKRKSSRQLLVEDADAWVKAIILERQGGMCLRKGGHYSSIRWEPENVVVMCRNHHIFWAHKNEYDFYQWIEKLYPGRIEKLKQAAICQQKTDLKELIAVLQMIYANEQAG